MNLRLFTPGPVEIPPRVLRVLAWPQPHHRTSEFRATLQRVTDGLKELHRTQGEVFVLAASGTGAMEAAVVNTMSRSDRALVIAGGKFGERWAAILKAYGFAPDVLDVEWGRSVSVAGSGAVSMPTPRSPVSSRRTARPRPARSTTCASSRAPVACASA